ncbi:DUF4019 domain-containing protein [Xenophilus sp. Marseille-Q4582]|uniref:DUF4019 domain-containing protein n=1 Tax=Xenophilus sp. Marseille-Q4582 TaxID=2866600 RepID=UPI001CE4524F|nr:DUF4019 domain-containing protein [Xenophilus sp. Marseille-Q4582]
MSPSLPLLRNRRWAAACLPCLAIAAALLLGACSLTRPASGVPVPPRLAGVAEPEPASPPSTLASAPPGGADPAAQPTSVQALLARSDASVRLIDAGQAAQLWPWAAPFLQQAGQRERILADIAQARAALGAIQGRSRAGAQGVQMVRLGTESRMPPPGVYANVEYTAQRAAGGTAVERLSFRQESDGWRFTGYTAQVASPLPPAAASAAPR